MLQANLQRHLHLACIRRSTCRVLSTRINLSKGRGDEDKVKVQVRSCTFHLKPVSVNSDSYDNFTNLTNQNSDNIQQRQINTGRKQEKFNIILQGTMGNLPSSSWATWHHAIFATLLPGSHDSSQDPRLQWAKSSNLPSAPSHRHPSVERLQFWDASVPPVPRCHLLQFQASKSKVSDTWRLQLWVEAFGAPPLGCHMPAATSARCHPEFVARPLLGSANRTRNSTLPAASTDSMLAEDVVLQLLLACLRRNTCSVLSESICRKDIGTRTKWR